LISSVSTFVAAVMAFYRKASLEGMSGLLTRMFYLGRASCRASKFCDEISKENGFMAAAELYILLLLIDLDSPAKENWGGWGDNTFFDLIVSIDVALVLPV
jgi:hypothetical protein